MLKYRIAESSTRLIPKIPGNLDPNARGVSNWTRTQGKLIPVGTDDSVARFAGLKGGYCGFPRVEV